MATRRQPPGKPTLKSTSANHYLAPASSPGEQLSLLTQIPSPTCPSPIVNGLGTGKIFRGVTQLSLVEHALCPLNPKESLRRGMVYDSHYFRFASGRAERIDVEITAGHGLSASDELLLWGLFALVSFDQDAGFVYQATPHYVLRRLGLSNKSKGGWNYRDFRPAGSFTGHATGKGSRRKGPDGKLPTVTMASKSSVIYTPRDQQIHELLALTPLDTQQLLKASETFSQPFTSDRKLRRRMQEQAAAGWVRTFTYATASSGQLNYYRLTAEGYRMLHGPQAALPKRSAFREVSPALQRHTRHLADVIVTSNISARRLGVELQEQLGENQRALVLGERLLKPDYSFRLATRDGQYTYYDELDESTEPIASTKLRESLEAKIRFHEDYQNATGERYRVRMFFAKASVRMVQFLNLARKHATRQRVIFYAVFLDDYLKHPSPLTGPLFVDHFHRLQSLVPASASRLQSRLPTLSEMLAEPAAVC